MQTFPIAGIGASAGGLDALKNLLVKLPVDTGLAFVIVQHLAPNQESMLPEILARSTTMPVKKVENGMLVEPNKVYVIPSGSTMTIDTGTLRLHPKKTSLKPIDEFLVSLAAERKTRAIGIILSGTGTDGTEGLSAIKAEGGITFAQEPKSAQYPDMPKSAIAAETVYFVLTPEQIAEELSIIAKHPEISRKKMDESNLLEGEEKDPQVIFTILKTAFGVNFSNYKKTTVNRRISRRMILNKIENMKEYTIYLRAHPEEQQALFEDLLISVTTFFREPSTFLIFKENVFSQLIENRQSSRQPIRVWIPGCSTGEEVYSVAIAIAEFLEEKHLVNIPTQIFGTDVNVKNIDKARRGIFSNTIEDNVSKDRLDRFFTRFNGNSQVIKPIRDMCIFAKHDLTQDPPFSNIDLIVCRNLLIYMESPMQERIISIFNYALKPNGYLVLGESESVGKFSTIFDSITKRGVVFKKKSGQPQFELPLQVPIDRFAEKISLTLPTKNTAISKLKEEVDELLMASYVPATLLVNSNSDVLVFRGQVNPYVSIEPGNASFNVTKLVRKELRPTVQTAIFRAKKTRREICETLRYEENGQTHIVTVQVRPFQLSKQEEPFFLVLFEEKGPAEKQTKTSKHATNESDLAKDQQIKELSEDLDSTKQTLQTVIEQQEASNEELRSANEEVQSSNEELMSTNEELETSKEELQSANEELTTLNEELKNRNQTLSHLNDDLANLMDNIDTAVIIVDTDLKIKRFTASAQELLRIMPSDAEHPISEVRLAIHVKDLEKLLLTSIRKLSIVRHEINDRNHWYQMRIRPYITGDKKIFGAVLSFSDITELKKWENEKKLHTQDLEKLVQEQSQEIVKSETLATIGKTAGMVGHDIRNPLQAIVSELYLAKTEVEELSDDASKKNLKENFAFIEEQIFYINKIVSDLQDIARKTTPQMIEINVEKTVREVLTSMPFSPNIESSFQVDKDFPKLVLDDSYLRRILTNLISNAMQAMPNGGKLSVSVKCQENNALIRVEDTGDGMSEEVKNKIFTPLFTTKAKGQGFGLPVVKKLTEAMGGTVSFESEKGNGVKFTLKFPIPKKSQS
jgi:two-component system, chemotaxis family, CheB/CheR fusion protein